MRNATLYALAALALFAAPAGAGEPTATQVFNLVPGWNAIYLNVQPAASDPAVVFQGLPELTVWTRGFETGGPEFIEDPAEVLRPELQPPGWLVYIPAGQPEAHLSTLVSIQGNRGFLVHLGPAGPVELHVTGRPLVPFINWQPAAFNLVGFPIDDAAPPTFASYFASSEAHRDQPIYRLLSTGVWERIAVPDAEKLKSGEAYQVYAASGTNFIAPLALDIPTTDGLAYGRTVTEHKLRLTNLNDVPAAVEVEALGQPDSVPLSFFRLDTEPPNAGTIEWPDLPSPHTIALSAGASRTLQLAVRRNDFAADVLGTVLSVRDGRGTRWLLPLTAAKVGVSSGSDTGSTAQAGSNTSPFTGLWVGQAVVTRVSQPNLSPPGMIPVGSVPGENVCQGGPNVGNACTGDSGCPVLCGFRCVGGSAAGATCSQASDCAGGTCAVPSRRCAGGVNAGLACAAADDCPGSRCGDLTDRCEGGPRQGGLCDAIDGNDCPNGTCGEVLRCANDQGVECTLANAATLCPGSTCEPVRLCASGDNIGNPCEAHDCPAGTCALPDNTCLGGANDGLLCQTDAQCNPSPPAPGAGTAARCNALTRCLGGPKNGQACLAHAECGASSCSAPSGQASEFPLRLLVHVDGDGKVRFLKQVIQMFRPGTTKRDEEDPEIFILGDPGEHVLLTNDELIPSFQGATLRDGVPVGRRLSTAAFDFPGDDLEMSGSFGCGAGEVSATIELDRDFPTNPYRHPYHPDHDNLSGGAGRTCSGGSNAGGACQSNASCPGNGRCVEVEEAFNIRRVITLDFAASVGTGASRPEKCADMVEGEYRETITGLHNNPILVAGSFQLERAALTSKLNQ